MCVHSFKTSLFISNITKVVNKFPVISISMKRSVMVTSWITSMHTAQVLKTRRKVYTEQIFLEVFNKYEPNYYGFYCRQNFLSRHVIHRITNETFHQSNTNGTHFIEYSWMGNRLNDSTFNEWLRVSVPNFLLVGKMSVVHTKLYLSPHFIENTMEIQIISVHFRKVNKYEFAMTYEGCQ